MRGHKTWLTWQQTQAWCAANPGKTAAIVTPKGTYVVKYEERQPDPKGMEWVYYGD